MSDTRELDDMFDELPPNVQQELQALEEIVYQQKQQLAELKTECDKLVDRDSAIIWLRAERDHRRQERDKAQQQLAELRRGVDNIKIRSYELGQHELHDKALALLGGGEK